MEWGWLLQLKDIDPKQVAPLLVIGVGIYLLLAKRIKAVEERMTKAEATAATVERISERLEDLFDLVKVTLNASRPSVLAATPTEELRLREIERWRDR